MAEIIYISCPICGMSRVLEKKGSRALATGKPLDKGIKGRIRLDHMDLGKAFIVQFRERQTGKEERKKRGGGRGFELRGGLTLEQMKNKEEYKDLITQLKSQINKIQQILA